MPTYKTALETALQCSDADRERLAYELLRSLEPPGEDVSPDEWAAAWTAEITRRLEALDRGEVKTIPWREAIQQLREAATERRTANS